MIFNVPSKLFHDSMANFSKRILPRQMSQHIALNFLVNKTIFFQKTGVTKTLIGSK